MRREEGPAAAVSCVSVRVRRRSKHTYTYIHTVHIDNTPIGRVGTWARGEAVHGGWAQERETVTMHEGNERGYHSLHVTSGMVLKDKEGLKAEDSSLLVQLVL